MWLANLFKLIGTAVRRWILADSDQLAASIAFHGVLSLAPLLLLVMSATSQLFGPPAPGYVRAGLETLMGARALGQSGHLIQMILDSRGGGAATLAGLVMFVVFGSAVFRQIRHALARIWGAPQRSFRRVLVERAVSYGLVPVVVIISLLVVVLSLMISVAGLVVVLMLPRGVELWGIVHVAVSFGLLTVLMAIVFRFGPGVDIRWSDVWGGAALTALLFMIGNIIIGMMMARSVLVPLYGSAGAVIVVMLWSYYTAHLMLFGAQFTRVYAERFGSWRERAHTTLPGPAAQARVLPRVDTKAPITT
jgi:membrane protein